jgi:hypothetical protein
VTFPYNMRIIHPYNAYYVIICSYDLNFTRSSSLTTRRKVTLPVARVIPDSSLIRHYISSSRRDEIFHSQYLQTCISIHISYNYTHIWRTATLKVQPNMHCLPPFILEVHCFYKLCIWSVKDVTRFYNLLV